MYILKEEMQFFFGSLELLSSFYGLENAADSSTKWFICGDHGYFIEEIPHGVQQRPILGY